jgi:VCBS repeat-containing protein
LNACGRPVHQLLSNYQRRQNGGDGWLRYMTFTPADNKIYVYTFSPTRNDGQGQFETDADSEFALDYDMNGIPFATIATVPNAPSDVNVTTGWPGLDPTTAYQWFVTVSDGVRTVTSPTWTFQTASAPPTIGDIADQMTSEDVPAGPVPFAIDDPDSPLDGLIVTASSADPTLIPDSNIVIGGSGNSRTISLAPEPNRSGHTTITVTVNDGTTSATETFTLTINPVDDVPTAAGQHVSTSEDVAIEIALSASDPEEGPLTFTVIDQPGHGALSGGLPNLTYTPEANYFGADSFSFRVHDGTHDSNIATINVIVEAMNDAPVANTVGYSTDEDTPLIVALPGILANDTDLDNEALTAAVVDGPSRGTLALSEDGGFVYTPNSNFAGSDSFTYVASDGAADSNVATVTITVRAVNDEPSIGDVADQSTDEDTATDALSFTVGDAETNAESLTFTGSSSNPLLVPESAIVFGGSGVNRTVTVTPATDQFGTTTITLTVSDGTAAASNTFILTVRPVNDTPTISDIVDQTIWLGTPLTLTSAGSTQLEIEFTVDDLETLDDLILSATSNNQTLIPDGGLSFGGAGVNRTLALNPLAGQTGTATISVTVDDGELQAVDTFVLNVAAAQPTVRVYSPNGGEKLFKKITYMISWTALAGSTPLASFDVLYSGDNGATFAILPGCANLAPTVHECAWTPAKITTAGLVRVVARDRANRTGVDESDATFTIVSGSPSISITAPKSGAKWPIGTVQTIGWKHNLGSDTSAAAFTVEISRHGKEGPWEVIVSHVPQLNSTRGQFDWTVTGPPLKRAKIRVRSETIPLEAMSDSFAIVAPR